MKRVRVWLATLLMAGMLAACGQNVIDCSDDDVVCTNEDGQQVGGDDDDEGFEEDDD